VGRLRFWKLLQSIQTILDNNINSFSRYPITLHPPLITISYHLHNKPREIHFLWITNSNQNLFFFLIKIRKIKRQKGITHRKTKTYICISSTKIKTTKSTQWLTTTIGFSHNFDKILIIVAKAYNGASMPQSGFYVCIDLKSSFRTFITKNQILVNQNLTKS
jgi:hypothetical protein